jgi:hypothetical protein
MTQSKMIFNGDLINEDKYGEIQYLDELFRELQNETLNDDWGYWHFSLLNLDKGENLELRILSTLSKIPEYQYPYNIDVSTGTNRYNSILDLKNLKFNSVKDLKNEFILKAEHWAYYQGPTSEKKAISDKFERLKHSVADLIFNFLDSKGILNIKIISGIDTYYSFGGDHCGEDILIETMSGVYIIHFGFSS